MVLHYDPGDHWARGQITVGQEHVASNLEWQARG